MNNSYFPSSNLSNYKSNDFSPFDFHENEQSYIENILKINKGSLGKFYCTFPDSNEWRDSVFKGILEKVGKDYIIISNPTNGKWYVILTIYLNYIEFEEKINYDPNFSIKGL